MKIKAMTILLLSVGIAIPVSAFAYYKYAMNRFSLSLNNIQVRSIGSGTMQLQVQFIVENTTGLQFTVLGNEFNVYANGILVGIARQNTEVTVPNNTITGLPVDLTIDTKVVGSAVSDFLIDKIFGNKAGVQITLQGNSSVRIDAPIAKLWKVNVAIDEVYDL